MQTQQARTKESIEERARNLFEKEGFRYEPAAGMPGTYFVQEPDEPSWSWLLVFIGTCAFCQCETFAEQCLCEHVLALRWEAEESARLDAEAAEREEWEAFGRHCLAAGKF